jgi:formylglycine-generating enzyme required for sulfatase activity
VVGVTWYEAVAYCKWLDGKLRQGGLLPAGTPGSYRVQLPSEAEWEKAARGTDGRIFPWGNTWQKDRANTDESSLNETSPVGIFPPIDQPYGLCDMAGNTWEWTLSKWGMDVKKPDYGYPYQSGDGREEAKGSDFRVLRGGSWSSDQRNARCAYRSWGNPADFDDDLGFRVVLSLARPGF